MNQLPLWEDEHELLQLLAHLARQPSQEMVAETPGDVHPEGTASDDDWYESENGSGYWLKDWQDIVSEEVCVPRWGEI